MERRCSPADDRAAPRLIHWNDWHARAAHRAHRAQSLVAGQCHAVCQESSLRRSTARSAICGIERQGARKRAGRAHSSRELALAYFLFLHGPRGIRAEPTVLADKKLRSLLIFAE